MYNLNVLLQPFLNERGGRPASPLSCILQTFLLCYKNAQVLLLDQMERDGTTHK